MEILVPQVQMDQLGPKDLRELLVIGETEDQQEQQGQLDPLVHQVLLDPVVI
jgi:hypothetical protein